MDSVSIAETYTSDTNYGTMHRTVYFLTHKDTGLRLGYYATLAGARIAQRQRNRQLGFIQRIERVEQFSNWEVELCLNTHGELLEATWVIVEDTIDSNEDLLEDKPDQRSDLLS